MHWLSLRHPLPMPLARMEPSVARAGLWQALAIRGSCVSGCLGPKRERPESIENRRCVWPPQGPGPACMGSGAPAWVGFAMFDRKWHRPKWLPYASAGSGRQDHLHPQGAKPVLLGSAPWPLHLQWTHRLFPPQTELGSSPECSRCSHLLPVLTHLPHSDALLCALSAAALPRPLFSPSAPRKPGAPIAGLLSPFSLPYPILPTPVAFSHLPECECVSLTVWEFPDWGQGSSPSPADLGTDLVGASVRTLEEGELLSTTPPDFSPHSFALSWLGHLDMGAEE